VSVFLYYEHRLIFCFLSLSILFPACKREQNSSDNVIHLSKAIDEAMNVKLSEICDSILFLPLETKDTFFLSANASKSMRFSSRYIYSMGYPDQYVFNWDGSFRCVIGKRGQAPGEDWIRAVAAKSDALYSLGGKLIKYDTEGNYMNRELPLHIYDAITDLGNAGENVALFYTDSLHFFDLNLTKIKSLRTVPDWPEATRSLIKPQVSRYFSDNYDSCLFYNYVNDTIYRILDSSIQDRWVMDLETKKNPDKYLLGDGTGYRALLVNDFRGGILDDNEYIRDTDDKIHVSRIFEAGEFVFIIWEVMREFAESRGKEPSSQQIAYYNKATNTSIAVNDKEGFIDDLSFLGYFLPIGSHNDYIISCYWPYELKEMYNQYMSDGGQQMSQINEFIENLDDDANPILVLAHLKD
jgi:hypothetical protein